MPSIIIDVVEELEVDELSSIADTPFLAPVSRDVLFRSSVPPLPQAEQARVEHIMMRE